MRGIMHTTTITLQELADIMEILTITSRQDDAAFLTTTGYHPTLGRLVIVQGIEEILLASEFPLRPTV